MTIPPPYGRTTRQITGPFGRGRCPYITVLLPPPPPPPYRLTERSSPALPADDMMRRGSSATDTEERGESVSNSVRIESGFFCTCSYQNCAIIPVRVSGRMSGPLPFSSVTSSQIQNVFVNTPTSERSKVAERE